MIGDADVVEYSKSREQRVIVVTTARAARAESKGREYSNSISSINSISSSSYISVMYQ